MLITHIYTLLAWMLSIALIILPLPLKIGALLPEASSVKMALFFTWVAVIMVIFWTVLIPFSTWLYLKTLRGTKVSFREAKEFTPLFFLNKSAKWYPMTELKTIPEAERVLYLRNFLQEKRQQGLIK